MKRLVSVVENAKTYVLMMPFALKESVREQMPFPFFEHFTIAIQKRDFSD
jgi:hypothetical protein